MSKKNKPGLVLKISKGLILNIVITVLIMVAGHAIFYTLG